MTCLLCLCLLCSCPTPVGASTFQLHADPLNASQTFQVVNAARPIASGATFKLLVAFTPPAKAPYIEILTLKSGLTTLRIALRGEGIAPELELGPEALAATLTTTGLDMGDVLKGDSAEKKFTVTNVCPFPLSFDMRFRYAVHAWRDVRGVFVHGCLSLDGASNVFAWDWELYSCVPIWLLDMHRLVP